MCGRVLVATQSLASTASEAKMKRARLDGRAQGFSARWQRVARRRHQRDCAAAYP